MKKILLLLCCVVLHPFIAGAQTQTDTTGPWTTEITLQANFSQVSLTNWQGGGQDALAGAGFINALANWQEGKNLWENKLNVGYGLLQQTGTPMQKTDDDLHFMSKFSRLLKKPWSLVTLADFQTTMTPGYKYRKDSATEAFVRDARLSKFMAPGYLILSAGAEYRPSDNFLFLVAPLSSKFTFVLDDTLSKYGAYGVEPGKTMRAELGAMAKSILRLKLMDNVLFENDITAFSNYKTFDQVDINWIANLMLKVNEYVNAKVGTHLIYDQDIQIAREDGTTGPSVQFKEVLTVGVQYTLR